jgi:nitrite reductase/ring-hydroxylating ferredoxin subunit/uncharacterized membrane protein
MRSTAHIKSHPIHPMLIPFPFAYLFGSAAVGLWARATGRRDWHRTSAHLNTLGIGSALVAAVPGLVDYMFAVPPKSSAKERATKHMLTNVSALALFTAARLGRRHPDEAPPAWALGLETIGAGLLGFGGWLGGTLVYRNQIGVDHRYASAGKWQVESVAPGQPEGSEVDVGAADELKVDQMKLVRSGSRRIVVARIESGVVAFDDRCTHKGGPLSDGVLACGTVQCPWHGSQFDVTSGKVKNGPAGDPIATYEVTERDGRLLLRVPAQDRSSLEPVGAER